MHIEYHSEGIPRSLLRGKRANNNIFSISMERFLAACCGVVQSVFSLRKFITTLCFFLVCGASVFSQQQSPLKQPAPADTGKAVQKAKLFDSLRTEDARIKSRYLAYPESFDSVFNTKHIDPYYSQKSNDVGISEIAKSLPQIVGVPFALSSNANRFMLYGFPALPNGLTFDNSVFADYPDALLGTDHVFSTSPDQLTIASPQGVVSALRPIGTISPQTDALWENGVFQESLLGLRFSRPLTKKIDFDLFSNFRYMAPFRYRTANDIRSLYDNFFSDTTMIANSGRNPLSNENDFTARIASQIGNTGTASLSYSYIDSKADQAFQQFNSTDSSTTLAWQQRSLYQNTLNAQIRSVDMKKYFLNADVKISTGGHTLYSPEGSSSLIQERSGKILEICAGTEPYIGMGKDTFSVILQTIRHSQQEYDLSTIAAQTGTARIALRRGLTIAGMSALLSVNAGDGVFKEAGKTIDHDLVYAADGTIFLGQQRLHLFVSRDVLPFLLPYDTLRSSVNTYNNVYEAYGADVFVNKGKIGCEAGIFAQHGIDTAIAGRFWPGNTMPYRQPDLSVMIAPMVGRVGGFALSSRLLLSDTKPFVKSQTVVNYETNRVFGREHIVSELILDYWSNRDTLTWGGINLWNRDIVSLSLHTSVHINNFSLFYKIDNILNRSYAYVPGYFMPGMTFRWGFQWLING